jgi:HlyD family secretion protein
MPKILNKLPNFLKKKWLIGTIIATVLIIGGFLIFHQSTPTYEFVTVKEGSITQSVSLTGNTTAAQSVSPGFGSSGTIAHAYSGLGKEVRSGQVLAELNMSDLIAQLHQVQAAYSVAKTTYEKLANGATGPDVEVAQVALNNAKDAYARTVSQQKTLVANAKSQLLNSGLAAVPANSAYSGSSPTITGTYDSNEEGTYTISTYSTGSGPYFSISGLENGGGQVSSLAVPLGTRGLFIQFPANFSSANSSWTVSLPNTQSSSYVTYKNAYDLALETQSQAIAAAQGAIDTAQAALNQKKAGARTEDLDIAKAQIDQARANIESVSAKIANARITAPISGTITLYDVKIGQLASLGAPLISIMAKSGYEVDAGVSETDIGKITLGNTVTMTLDAFPGEVFSGRVFYIAPSETNTSGVVSYQVKISFDKEDPRLKSGLTANIEIDTLHKDNILVLPQYAILENDNGTFVEILSQNKVVEKPVTLGISDQEGNVEIISGVALGEEVLNIGLKTK